MIPQVESDREDPHLSYRQQGACVYNSESY